MVFETGNELVPGDSDLVWSQTIFAITKYPRRRTARHYRGDKRMSVWVLE